ncbi:hypothetical protein Hte_009720 [Hypoxylon texense]
MANAIRNPLASHTPDPIQDIFVKAKLEFLSELKDKKKQSELEKNCTIDDIWSFTDQLQSDQGPEGRLRGLRKIQPYLERLEEYAGVVEVFVQVKPDILALIWGPIKLLLQMSRNVTKCFDAILDVMKSIGPALPAFSKFTSLLEANTRIGYVLGLYFKDILDFYLTCFKFFGLKGWQVAFEGFWPIHRSRIDVIVKNMEKHSFLLCNELSMGDVLEADEARREAYAHYEKEREFRDCQNFQSIETYISPPLYDDALDSLRLSRCTSTGTWLQQDPTFCRWLDSTDVPTSVIWIRGIPGAGMFLYARLILENIEALQDVDQIREELRVLPESLDEIYERILGRIVKLPAAAQKSAKRILSWVACSPQPITRQEMELALLIEPNTETIPRVRAKLNTLQLCGPLIEIRHGYLQFVHFTAKEYVLNHKAQPFINQMEAVLDVAMTCLGYLCCEVFAPSTTDEEVQEHLIAGAYRLFQFSRCNWVESIKQLRRYYTIEEPPRELVGLLHQLLAVRSNVNHVRGEIEHHSRLWGLGFLEEFREIQEMLSRVLDFQSWQQKSDACQLERDCEYSTIGFLSQVECDQHYDHLHSAPGEDSATLHDSTSLDEIEHFLYDLVARDEVDEMKRSVTHLKRLGKRKLQKVQELVAFSGSLEMAKVLIDRRSGRSNSLDDTSKVMIRSVQGRNVPVFAWLCEKIVVQFSRSQFQPVLDSDCTELFDIWRANLTRFGNLKHSLALDVIPQKPIPNLETTLAKFWTENNALRKFEKESLNMALKQVATYCRSVHLATTLIQCGADPNYKGSTEKSTLAFTPLILASKKRTEEAANIMKVLLLAGADPHYERKINQGQNKGTTETAAMGAGARSISRWLGMTWDELVTWTQEERKKNATVQIQV